MSNPDTLECGCSREVALYADVEPAPDCKRHAREDSDQ